MSDCESYTVGQQVICNKCGMTWDVQDRDVKCGQEPLTREETQELGRQYIRKLEAEESCKK